MYQERLGVVGRIFIRYSESFRLKVLSEIKPGSLTLEGIRRQYGIRSGTTVQKWLRGYGKNLFLVGC